MKAKAPSSERAPGGPEARPGPVGKPARKKKKRFWKSKAQGGSRAPEGGPRVVAGRPPKAPEDFSQNWKALQELLKQKAQSPGKPLVVSQMDSKKQPEIIQQNRKEISDKARSDERPTKGQEAPGGVLSSGSDRDRTVAVPAVKASRAEDKKRTSGDAPLQRGDAKQKKRKAAEVASAPAPPTEDDLWFDDVDPEDVEAAIGPEAADVLRRQLGQSRKSVTLEKQQAFSGLTRALAIDCEMVGVGPKGEESIVARVSLVNQYGKCIYDKYVQPTEPVTDYRTAVSGIRPQNLKQGEELEVVQREVAEMLKGRILVGHALHNDLKVLFLDHPKKKIRDTQKYKPFKSQVKSSKPSLKLLSKKILGIEVQQKEHCSIQDAQAAMRLYVTVRREWESTARDRRPPAPTPGGGPVAVAALRLRGRTWQEGLTVDQEGPEQAQGAEADLPVLGQRAQVLQDELQHAGLLQLLRGQLCGRRGEAWAAQALPSRVPGARWDPAPGPGGLTISPPRITRGARPACPGRLEWPF